MAVPFETRTFKGTDGTVFEISSFSASVDGTRKECAKLSRKGFRMTPAAMRLDIEDLGVLAMHAREAFLEAIGRISLEVTPKDLREGDAIEGLGEIEAPRYHTQLGEPLELIVTVKGTGTQLKFVAEGEPERFNQLLDITRPKPVIG